MNKPKFITFTGADDHTDIDRMVELSSRYPIEWGILFSPKRQGQGRYPSGEFVRRLTNRGSLRLSAHLCGQHSRWVISRGSSPIWLGGFERAQINSAEPNIDYGRIARWGEQFDVQPILQCRGAFPLTKGVSWLFDQSGGRGIEATWWPSQHGAAMCGYAGGIGPDNVLDVLAQLNASDFWIDMESSVRDKNNRFSLDRCEAVCQAVYGTTTTTR